MAITPPDKFLEWATNTEALSADPGTTLTADGWTVGDAPAPAHSNYATHSAAGWGGFASQVLAGRIAFGNIDRTGATTLHDDNAGFYLRYDEVVNRWYAVLRDGIGAPYEVYIYDSDDGETWNELPAPLNTDVFYSEPVTRPVVGGGQLVVGIEDKVYVSTDATIANMNIVGVSVATLTKIRELAYDAIEELWICVGGDGTDGKIATATDPAGTWTVRDTDALDEMLSLAIDPNTGISVAGNDQANGMQRSTNSVSWSSASVSPTGRVDRAIWAPSLNRFLCTDLSDNLWTTTDGVTWTDTGYQAAYVFTTAEFTWLIDWNDDVFVIHPRGTYYGYTFLGAMSGEDIPVINGTWSNCEIHGGQGKLVFPYGTTTNYLAIARYGAQT